MEFSTLTSPSAASSFQLWICQWVFHYLKVILIHKTEEKYSFWSDISTGGKKNNSQGKTHEIKYHFTMIATMADKKSHQYIMLNRVCSASQRSNLDWLTGSCCRKYLTLAWFLPSLYHLSLWMKHTHNLYIYNKP